MIDPKFEIFQLPHGEGLALPAYESDGAAGMDVRAALPALSPLALQPGERALVPTGLIMAIPQGFEVQIRPRSGLALKHGITCLNTPGTIDSDYRGEVQVLLINLGQEPFVIERGMRIAQMVLAPVVQATIKRLDAPPAATARAGDGFGSTGVE